PTAAAASETTEEPSTNGKTFVSPVVAKIASEHGVDPSQVPGTGRGGRVTKKDILNFIESGGQAAPQPAVPAPPQAPKEPAPVPVPVPAPAPAQVGESFEPMTAMRRGIAEHMRRSLDTSAHVTSAIEVDMSTVSAIRSELKKGLQESYGVNLTYLAFIARATVETLHDYPYINGERRGDQIVTRNHVNLALA